MPLSPADVHYLNKLLDRYVKNQKSWPWMRWFQLGMSIFFIGSGIWAGSMVLSMARITDFATPTTHKASSASTQYVTYQQLRESLETERNFTRMDMMIDGGILVSATLGLMILWMGINLALMTLFRWNRHRRDAILITLLREKCAAELSPQSAA